MKLKTSSRFGRTLFTVTCALSALLTLVSFNASAGDGPRIAVATATDSGDDGHVAANAIDGSLSTRWSAYGDGQWLNLDLGLPATIGGVHIAWYNGNQRQALFDIQTSSDGANWTTVYTGVSSGTTTNFESYQFADSTALFVRIVGHGNSQDLWNSIEEVQVFAPGSTSAPPPPATNSTPWAVQSVSASSSASGTAPAYTLDGKFSTRWSASGDGQWIAYKLTASDPIRAANIAWYKGDTRIALFDVQTSPNGSTWQTVFSGASSGVSTNYETFNLAPTTAQYVRIVGHGNSQDLWNSITEVRWLGTNSTSGGGTVTNAPAPVAAFGASSMLGVAPLAVQFTDQSSGSPTAWSWNFGDSTTSTAQNPSHTYSSAGTYTAKLTVTGSSGQTSSASHTITVTNAPVQATLTASFVANPNTGVAPLAVVFSDLSTGGPVSWSWNFGDGATSTAQNPSHTYTAAGSYTATLTVKNSAGNTSSKSTTIQVSSLVLNKLPAQVLNLLNWKLTLPIGTQGSPTEITQPALATYVNASYFSVNSTGDGVVFTANCGGVTTSGSGYPRSELREMVNNGATPASWSTTSGTSTMEVTEAITHLPVVKPQVIAGQIHDGVTKVIDCRLDGNTLFIENATGGTVVVLNSNYQLGTKFSFKWVAHNGGVDIYYNGQFITTYTVSDSGCYFKCGDYTQSNTSKGDAATAYGQVVVYGVTVTHQ